jgi:hypothetical protein
MLKRTENPSIWSLIVLVGACALLASPVVGQVTTELCGDAERMAFQNDAEAGIPIDELVNLYGNCANSVPSGDTTTKVITINNGVGSTFYEQMNGCGYHPQIRVAACDVEVKRATWYGPYPTGSNEHVTFCFFCGGGWIPVPGAVHVTNDVSGTIPSWGFMAYAAAPAACPAGGTGVSFPVRATLSWAVPAGNPCTQNPSLIWGNQITFDTRDDP